METEPDRVPGKVKTKMKKLMIVAMAALWGTVGFADVESSNVVGYTTVALKARTQDIMGAPFVSVADKSFSVQNLTIANPTDGVDWIKVYNPETGKYEKVSYWDEVYESSDAEDSMGAGWGDEDGTVVNMVIDPGQGFWIKTDKTTTVTIPGEVLAATDNMTSLKARTQDMVAGIFPVTLSLQDVSLSNPTDGVDWIKVYNAETGKYEKASYWDEVYESSDAEDSMGTGWGDEDGTVVNISVTPGQGFWMKTDKNNAVTFKVPTGI